MPKSFINGAVERAEVILRAYGPYGVSYPMADARDAISDILQYLQSNSSESHAFETLLASVRYWKNGFVDG